MIFYDADGKLTVFDISLTQKHNCIVIRRDLLDCFLKETGLELVWLVDCEKEINALDLRIENEVSGKTFIHSKKWNKRGIAYSTK